MREGISKLRISSPLLAGLTYTLLTVLGGTLFTSLLLSFTGVKESSLSYFAYTILVVSLLIGGWASGKRAGERGWYHGGLCGIIYAVILVMISFLGYDQSLGMGSLMVLVISFASSALGGVFGVNMRK